MSFACFAQKPVGSLKKNVNIDLTFIILLDFEHVFPTGLFIIRILITAVMKLSSLLPYLW